MKLTRILLIVLAAGLLSLPALADSVTINNPGFEVPSLSPGGWSTSIPGWTMGPGATGTAGIFYPGAAQYPGGIPEGNNVAFSKGPWVAQILTTTLLPNTVYTLTVNGGYRLDNANLPFVGFTIWLMAGENVLASTSSATGTLTPGNWMLLTASYTSGANDPFSGQPLQILLTVNNPNDRFQVNFDDVQLDATGVPSSQTPSAVPEPGTLALLGTGLLVLAKRVRRIA